MTLQIADVAALQHSLHQRPATCYQPCVWPSYVLIRQPHNTAQQALIVLQRYSIHHPSLFPRIVTVREHYFCTSHVGEPFNAWDIR